MADQGKGYLAADIAREMLKRAGIWAPPKPPGSMSHIVGINDVIRRISDQAVRSRRSKLDALRISAQYMAMRAQAEPDKVEESEDYWRGRVDALIAALDELK